MILKNFLKENAKRISYYIISNLILLVCFLLYHLPIEAVLYPIGINALIGFFALYLSYRKYKVKYLNFQKIKENLNINYLSDEATETIFEEFYKDIINDLDKIYISTLENHSNEIQDYENFYSTWIHQVKVPIAASKLILESEDSENARNLKINLNRIEQYTNMVLSYLRLNSKSTDYVFKQISIDKLIRSTIKKFSTEFINRRISLEYDPINKDLLTDEKWFSLVIEQLLSNALKYTNENGKIKIYLSEDSLIIEDSGIGIAADDLPRIFDKGFTGYNGRENKQSSGLGLFLSKEIINNLGLDLKIESGLANGTKAIINLDQEKRFYD